MSTNVIRVVGAAAGLALVAGAASAGLSNIVLDIRAEVGGQVAQFSVPQSAGTWNGQVFTWNLAQPVPIQTAGGVTLGVLTDASVHVIQDPVVAINFNIASTALNTAFTITSPVLSFSAISGAVGSASAAVSVTDLLGDGATLTPGGAGAYRAQYNGALPGGTNFATLVNAPVVAGAFSTTTFSQDFPGGGGFVPIAGSVADISAQWDFTISPDDLASGTGVFTVIPAPASAALLALGGALVGRRRR
jgi:uncharacterized protein (TIGR03382 family)